LTHSNRADQHIRADYGLDAPPVIRRLLITGVGALAFGLAVNFASHALAPNVGQWLGVVGQGILIVGIVNFVFQYLAAGLLVWSSKVGKLNARDHLLDSIPWKGGETVLDVGCGRGLLLNGAAKRLTTGRAIGVDIWQPEDQSGNSREVTLANARAENVRDRVEVRDGDARRLPFKDGSFDVIVSNLALHNIYQRPERDKALKEIVRVLKPGGRLAIMDFRHTDQYAEAFRAAGLSDVMVSRLNFRIFPPVRTVTAVKLGEG
jgi:SAM-dependent methyltransferase